MFHEMCTQEQYNEWIKNKGELIDNEVTNTEEDDDDSEYY